MSLRGGALPGLAPCTDRAVSSLLGDQPPAPPTIASPSLAALWSGTLQRLEGCPSSGLPWSARCRQGPSSFWRPDPGWTAPGHGWRASAGPWQEAIDMTSSTWPLPALVTVLMTRPWKLPPEQVTQEGQCLGRRPFSTSPRKSRATPSATFYSLEESLTSRPRPSKGRSSNPPRPTTLRPPVPLCCSSERGTLREAL